MLSGPWVATFLFQPACTELGEGSPQGKSSRDREVVEEKRPRSWTHE